MTLDFLFDVVCPYAYLASTQVEALARRRGALLRWQPVLLGGLLRATGGPDDPNQTMNAAKRRIMAVDRARTAALLGVPLREPPQHPRRTVDAMRLVLAAPDGGLWSGPKVVRYVRTTWAIEIAPQTGWKWLVDLGFTLQVPRPSHPTAADPAARKRWKKTYENG